MVDYLASGAWKTGLAKPAEKIEPAPRNSNKFVDFARKTAESLVDVPKFFANNIVSAAKQIPAEFTIATSNDQEKIRNARIAERNAQKSSLGCATNAKDAAAKIAGNTAQAGLMFVPGAGQGASLATRVGTGIATGAGFGAAGRLAEGNANAGDLAKSAAVGGATGGALEGAGSLLGKLKIGGSKVASETSKGLEKASDDMAVKSLGLTKGQKNSYLEKSGEKAAQTIRKYEIKSVEDIPKKIAPLQSEFDSIVSNVNKQFTPEEVHAAYKAVYEPMLQKGQPIGRKQIGEKLKAEADNLLEGLDGTNSASVLNEKRKAFDALAYGLKKSDPSAADVNKQSRDILSHLLQGAADTEGVVSSNGLTMKEVGQELSKLRRLNKIANKNIEGAGGHTAGNLVPTIGAGAGGTIAGVPGLVSGWIGTKLVNSGKGQKIISGAFDNAAEKTAELSTKLATKKASSKGISEAATLERRPVPIAEDIMHGVQDLVSGKNVPIQYIPTEAKGISSPIAAKGIPIQSIDELAGGTSLRQQLRNVLVNPSEEELDAAIKKLADQGFDVSSQQSLSGGRKSIIGNSLFERVHGDPVHSIVGDKNSIPIKTIESNVSTILPKDQKITGTAMNFRGVTEGAPTILESQANRQSQQALTTAAQRAASPSMPFVPERLPNISSLKAAKNAAGGSLLSKLVYRDQSSPLESNSSESNQTTPPASNIPNANNILPLDASVSGMSSGMDALGNPIGDTSVDNGTDDMTKKIDAAIVQALASGDTKGLNNLLAVADYYDKRRSSTAKPMNSTAAGVITDLESGIANIQDLGQQIKQSDANMPFVGDFLAKNPLNTNAKTLQANIASVKQLVGKALEGGVLRAEDEVKYSKILPTLNDSDEVAQAKIDMITNDLRQKLALYKQNISSGVTDTLPAITQ